LGRRREKQAKHTRRQVTPVGKERRIQWDATFCPRSLFSLAMSSYDTRGEGSRIGQGWRVVK
jgi:hypothetical protein